MRPPSAEGKGKTGGAVGLLATLGVLIAKFFAYFKLALPIFLKTGLSMMLMLGVYWSIWGWKFALGFVILLFLHECGHLIAARQFGLKVGAPVFIPFMGAFIALKEAPRNAWIEAVVGIGGPIFGSLAALACHVLGMQLDLPLLIGLAYTGYWLNLFNLIPLGQLDGGRIATALTPWLWVPGLAILGWLAWQNPNVILIFVLLLSIPRLLSLFRRRTPEEMRYFEVTPGQRWTIGLAYFGLVAALALAMNVAQEQIRDYGLDRHRAIQKA